MQKNIFIKIKETIKEYKWWELTIIPIGFVSLITIVSTLFLPVGTGPHKYNVLGTVPPVGSIEFPQILADSLTLPLEKGPPVQVLNNGDEFMKSFLNDIDNAHSSVNLMMYIWDDGRMSDLILEHAEKKLAQGVQVRIVLDGVGGQFASMKKFEKAGGQLIVYHPLSLLPWNLSVAHKRNHRRSLVIDGKIGYIGGIAVDDKWLGNAENKDHWRDYMFRVSGNMAAHLQGIFSELWAENGDLLTGKDFYPTAENKGTITYVPMASSPTNDTISLQKYFLLSFLSAQRKIYITSPYFILDSALSNALQEKAKQGVDVRVLVPNELTDNNSVRNASRFGYQNLLAAGVKIYEYQPTFIHAKDLIVDNTWTVIGSANMDNRSRMLNEEDVFGISDPVFGSQMEGIYLKDLNSAKEITLSDWQNRGSLERVRELFAIKFIQQY
ncbi:MAG: phospholipase D-like domain-containing protein [Candidatus Doudnabacteria bacterium]